MKESKRAPFYETLCIMLLRLDTDTQRSGILRNFRSSVRRAQEEERQRPWRHQTQPEVTWRGDPASPRPEAEIRQTRRSRRRHVEFHARRRGSGSRDLLPASARDWNRKRRHLGRLFPVRADGQQRAACSRVAGHRAHPAGLQTPLRLRLGGPQHPLGGRSGTGSGWRTGSDVTRWRRRRWQGTDVSDVIKVSLLYVTK